MSILIKGMQMPVRGNSYLEIVIHPDGTVFSGGGSYLGRLAVELPPHGDLIDRSDVLAVVDEAYEYGDIIKRKDFDETSIPTIVPAEGGTT